MSKNLAVVTLVLLLVLGLICIGFFPPPPSFPLMLAWQHLAGAGHAPDADEAALVEGIVGDVIHADVFPDLL